jgi:hypothetical protein
MVDARHNNIPTFSVHVITITAPLERKHKRALGSSETRPAVASRRGTASSTASHRPLLHTTAPKAQRATQITDHGHGHSPTHRAQHSSVSTWGWRPARLAHDSFSMSAATGLDVHFAHCAVAPLRPQNTCPLGSVDLCSDCTCCAGKQERRESRRHFAGDLCPA